MKEANVNTNVEEKVLNMDEKVQVKNLCEWSIGFARIDGTGDISIPANATIRLTRGEIYSQVQTGNKLFSGTDGRGSHARLYILDKPTRIDLDFECDDDKSSQNIVTDEKIKEVFAIKSINAFENTVKEMFITHAEKAILAGAVKKFKLNELNKAEFIKAYTGMPIE